MASQEASPSYTHSQTLLDLLMCQQTQDDVGVRLNFHSQLLEPITLLQHPYHYCAVSDRAILALHLHSLGVPVGPPIPVAAFSAAGTSGGTPWKKTLTVSPREAALLAGHADTAKVLANIEGGTPLHWSRTQHHRFPDAFKREVQQMLLGLVRSEWFAALPGAVRLQVVDTLVREHSRTTVWPTLPAACWAQPLSEMLEAPALEACGEVTAAAASRARGGAPAPALPQYQFRVGGGRGRTGMKGGWWGALLRGAACAAVGGLVLRAKHDQRLMMLAYAAGAVTNGLGLPAAVVLLGRLMF